ncbi:hypothetical protein O181_023785 [Austropuccinia psidii MF-1]|uniref:Ribosomal protein L1 n=1 Tax=Austropuccinia psidii MF-1 TaxID=1389203 RepID=A0A9Q3CJ87_9BASI|nr:hypothetical protein [Austropuccinia psidii MF-1]
MKNKNKTSPSCLDSCLDSSATSSKNKSDSKKSVNKKSSKSSLIHSNLNSPAENLNNSNQKIISKSKIDSKLKEKTDDHDSDPKNQILSQKIPMIKPDQIDKALKTLINHSNQSIQEKIHQGQLFADDIASNDTLINLIISLKRIINRPKHKPIKLNLSHSLLDPKISPVCLIVKDPQRDFKDLLDQQNIKFISKVVGISKLKGKHSSFEARRLLLNSHSLFLADERVLPILPGILGNKFFQSKKLPIPVNIQDPQKLKAELEKAISSTYLRIGTGSCLNIKIADLSRHNDQEIKENLVKVLEQLGKKIPMGGWGNIQSVHIKTGTSISLPIWLSELNDKEFGRFNLTPTPDEHKLIEAAKKKKEILLKAKTYSKKTKKRPLPESNVQSDNIEKDQSSKRQTKVQKLENSN